MNTDINKKHPYGDVPTVIDTSEVGVNQLAPKKSGPVELEIGFGKGHFLLERAETNPGIRFIGLEVRRKLVHLVAERALKRKLSNVRVWFGDAGHVLRRIAEDACLANVFINFPDPWWKKRHAKRMVVTPQLIVEASRLLEDKGKLFIQTDVDFRVEAYRDIISSNRDLRSVYKNGTEGENPFGARSLRELKCEGIGLPIYRLLYGRVERNRLSLL
ncbi:MAG: tRNA (guanosine(46)-N7)-methyltransferase TrmB [Proteobacteria bacterium]|nr:tRNA (guanosine(46)-N7)-methyltransferase TrmB [Pseudomonadota bacterium]